MIVSAESLLFPFAEYAWLYGAVTALEEVMKSFGAPAVVDSVAACNLKTLYELCRTPEALRLIN